MRRTNSLYNPWDRLAKPDTTACWRDTDTTNGSITTNTKKKQES